MVYEVYYSDTNATDGLNAPAGNVTDTSYTINGLTNGTPYWVWIKAKNNAGTSGFSPAVTGTPEAPLEAPAAPSAATVTEGHRRLRLNWAQVLNADSYEVFYSEGDDPDAADPFTGTIDSVKGEAIITGLANGTAYKVWLKAVNTVGTSGFSPVANGTPYLPAPTNLQLTAEYDTEDPGKVVLTGTWDLAEGVTYYHYDFERDPFAGNFVWPWKHTPTSEDAVITKTLTPDLGMHDCFFSVMSMEGDYYAPDYAPQFQGKGMPAQTKSTLSVTPSPNLTNVTGPTPAVVAGDGVLQVSWTKPKEATASEVWYSTADNPASAEKYGEDNVGTRQPSPNVYFDEPQDTTIPATNGQTYYVWIKVKNPMSTSQFGASGSGTPFTQDLSSKFSISSNGTQRVTDTFNAVHNYRTHADFGTADSTIQLGDYIDLESLTVAGETLTNVDLGAHGKTLRLIVVDINSFQDKNDNGTVPHVVFQFQNAPFTPRRMHGSANANSLFAYTASELGSTLSLNFVTGLENAGVPTAKIWTPKRLVGYGNPSTTEQVEVEVWLPSYSEIMGATLNSETVQAKFTGWYDSPVRRIKYNASGAAVQWWLATGSSFRQQMGGAGANYFSRGVIINTDGTTTTNAVVTTEYSYAPAFCIGGDAE
jgi:hypothetical protein